MTSTTTSIIRRVTIAAVAVLVTAGMAFTFAVCAPVATDCDLGVAQAHAKAKPKLNKTKKTLFVKETLKLKVKNNKSKKKVTWKSSKPKIVKVGKSGKVTAKKIGKATITAKVGKKKLKCKITVVKAMSCKTKTMTLTPTPIKSAEGYLVKSDPTATVTVKFGKALKYLDYNWSVENHNIAEMDLVSTGKKSIKCKITGLKPGTTTVTVANSINSEKVKIKVTVKRAFNVEVRPYYYTFSRYAKSSKGEYSTEYYLPIVVTNHTNQTMKINSGSVIYAPDRDGFASNLSTLVLYKIMDFPVDDYGGNNAFGIGAVVNYMVSSKNTVSIAPGASQTLYALVGNHDLDVSGNCAIGIGAEVNGVSYPLIMADFYGTVFTW